MASSITVPVLQAIENYDPAIATALIAVATAAKADIDASAVSGAMRAPAATVAALTAIDITAVTTGTLCLVESDNTGVPSLWQYVSTSSATETTKLLVAAPDAGSGAWLRMGGSICLKLAVDKTLADNATLFTCPTGVRLKPREAYWDVTVSWSGGTSSAIGVHASPTGWTTKGDILGGASGDLAATLVSTNARMVGTVGAQLDTYAHGRLILVAADTLNYDKIASTYTAGSGFVRVLCDVLANAGA